MLVLFTQVQSESDPSKYYTVRRLSTGEYRCECPNFVYREKRCKHIEQTMQAVNDAAHEDLKRA